MRKMRRMRSSRKEKRGVAPPELLGRDAIETRAIMITRRAREDHRAHPHLATTTETSPVHCDLHELAGKMHQLA